MWDLETTDGVVNLRSESFQALKADAGEAWARSHDFHYPVAPNHVRPFSQDLERL